MTNREVAESVPNGARMSKPKQCPEKLYEVMCECWNTDPSLRPTFDYLHDFFLNFEEHCGPVYAECTAVDMD